jgi:methylated-DNA-[protein]-cysteine S-methyltransferase
MPASASRTFFTVFDTTLGPIGLAWKQEGLVRLQLPARDAGDTRRRLTARLKDAVEVALPETAEDAEKASPAWVAEAVALIRRYAAGEKVDFSSLPVALEGVDPFRRAIYRATRKLGYGETTTYGALAEEAGFPQAARETGAAMGSNPVPLVVPCHRVLAAGGRIGGFSAPGGAATKEKLLTLEGVQLGPPAPAQASFAF